MKRKFYALLLPLALVLCASAMAADEPVDVAGNWQLNWQGRQGAQQGTLTLQQDGTKLTGTMQGQRGATPVTGTIKGNTVSFNVEFKGERRSFALAFTGAVDGDKMSGTLQPQGGRGDHGGRGGQEGEGGQSDHSWTATRQAGHSSPSDGSSNSN